jgi:hypothetical protein
MKLKLFLFLALAMCGAIFAGCRSARAANASSATDFACVTNPDGTTVTIRGYTGSSGLVTIPGTINGLRVTAIGDRAFWANPRVTSVIIPDTVTSIGEGAFSAVDSHSSLTNIVIGNGVLTIGSGAFHFCDQLTSVRIPKKVSGIGIMAFGGCFGLKSIVVDSGNAAYCSRDGILYNSNQTELVQYPPGKAGDFVIPNTVTGIVDYALWNCPYLTSVTIPEGITAISQEEFAACGSLATVIVPASVTNIGPNAFNSCVSMRGIYFHGNAPNYGEPWRGGIAKVLGGLDTGTIYYVPGTTGWGPTFGGRPTAPWKP